MAMQHKVICARVLDQGTSVQRAKLRALEQALCCGQE